jgi:hypothetical protein
MHRSRDEQRHATTARLWRFRTSAACTTATNVAPRSTHSSCASVRGFREAEERRQCVRHLSTVLLECVQTGVISAFSRIRIPALSCTPRSRRPAWTPIEFSPGTTGCPSQTAGCTVSDIDGRLTVNVLLLGVYSEQRWSDAAMPRHRVRTRQRKGWSRRVAKPRSSGSPGECGCTHNQRDHWHVDSDCARPSSTTPASTTRRTDQRCHEWPVTSSRQRASWWLPGMIQLRTQVPDPLALGYRS